MMSISLVASCLRMANISSCLRMVLAFSISCSSAKAKSSGGVLDFRSCNFISRMRVFLGGYCPAPDKKNDASEKGGKWAKVLLVKVLGWALRVKGASFDVPCVQ